MKLGYEEIRRREAVLKQHFLDHINHDKIELYTPSVNSPMITFNMLNNQKQIIDAQDIEYYLNQHNILARSSLSCAKLAKYPLKTRNVLRISLLFYNDFDDINKLLNIINNFNPGDELNGLI
ncbi:aminotransferase class V-fold PLP-dependent enzyme [bacterium]|nr:aminotransferase class V-fold PLP-dependent enzyme [bacterium]